MTQDPPFVEKPRLGEWVQLAGFISGALGLFATGVMAFGDLKEHDRRLDKLEARQQQTDELNVRLARIEGRLDLILAVRKGP
jgi:hypothetical protein